MSAAPLLIVVTGRPGSGKTTLARALAERIPCPLLSRDALKEGLLVTRGASHAEVGGEANRAVYEAFFELMEGFLGRGISLVVEAAFQHGLWSRGLESITSPVRLRLVLCEVEPQLAARRCVERALGDARRVRFHGDALKAPESVQAYTPPRLEAPTLRVDTSGEVNIDNILEFIMKRVDKAGKARIGCGGVGVRDEPNTQSDTEMDEERG